MKIILSKRAANNLEKLLIYLESEWSKKTMNDFIVKLDFAVKSALIQPNGFPKSDKIKGLHKCVVTKQTTLFYKFDKNRLIIVSIFDTRQHPKKI